MRWKWFRRKPKQTPEEAYIKELNEAAERRESQPPSPYIPLTWSPDQITADQIYSGTITADKIDFPTFWKHDHTKPIVSEEIQATSIDQGRING